MQTVKLASVVIDPYINILEDKIYKLKERIKQLEEAYMKDKLLGKQT